MSQTHTRVHEPTPAPDHGRAGRTALVLLVFAGSLVVLLFHHEPWRDELQAWGIARASATPMALLHHARYEGHPMLWYLVLWPFARITGDPRAMLAVNVAIATGTAALVLFRAPFRWWMRVAFVFSYFPFFEYGVVARNYGLGMLLGIAATAAIAARARPVVVGLLIGALALTSAYGTIIAGAILSAYLLDRVLVARRDGQPIGRMLLVPVGLAVIAVGVAVRQMVPPADAPFGVGTGAGSSHGLVFLDNVWRALVPLPRTLGTSFWESNIVDVFPHPHAVALAPAAVLAVLVLVVVRRSPAACWLWIAGLGVLEVFTVLRPGDSYIRQAGSIVTLAVAALWTAGTSGGTWDTGGARVGTLTRPVRRALERLGPVADAALVACLVVSVVAAGIATVNELRAPFSGAEAVADQLRASGLDHAFITAYPDFMGAGVAIELDRPIWYPTSNRAGTYIVWDARRHALTPTGFVAAVNRLARHRRGRIVVVSHHPLHGLERARLIGVHHGRISHETFRVYVVP